VSFILEAVVSGRGKWIGVGLGCAEQCLQLKLSCACAVLILGHPSALKLLLLQGHINVNDSTSNQLTWLHTEHVSPADIVLAYLC
jgi:hypothetical protein